MSKRESRDYLEEILDAALAAGEFVQGMSSDQFAADLKTRYAVVRALEIVGEATKNVEAAYRDSHPEIPWRLMAGMRDRLIHGYATVDYQVVWQTVTCDLPTVVPLLRAILATDAD